MKSTKLPNPSRSIIPTREKIADALMSEAAFHDTFKDFSMLNSALNKYKEDGQLCTSIIHFLTQHPKEFKHIFINTTNITYLACRVSKQLGEDVIQFVLDHPEEFSRLIRYKSDLNVLCKAFPNHACIFQQSTVQHAKEVALLIHEVREKKSPEMRLSLTDDEAYTIARTK